MRPFLVILTFMVPILQGCLSLDPFLFNGLKENEYRLDAYTGERECASYLNQRPAMKASLVHEFALKSGGETIYGVYVRHDSTQAALTAADTMVVYFHGNADNLDRYWPRTRMLWETGYPALIFDYRGYGKSTGKTTEQSIYDDAATVMNYVRDSLGNPRVIIYGYSLGSIPGVDVAAHPSLYSTVIMLALEAPIGKVETIVQNGTSLDIPGSYLTTFSGDNAEKAKSVRVPLLWLGGTQDETLPRETQGQRVWNNYPDPEKRGRFVVIPNGHHSDLPQTMSPDYSAYLGCVRHFIRDSTDTWFQRN